MMFRLAEYARIQQGIIILPPSLQKDFELLPLKWFGALLFLQKFSNKKPLPQGQGNEIT
jgi:hypothetical protein